MDFVIEKVPYTVEARELLTSGDPDDLSFCDTRRRKIELLANQSLESATLALTRAVCDAWLAGHDTPRTAAAFRETGEELLIAFYDEFTRQGGRAALAGLMGLPYEGNGMSLETADWTAMHADERRRFIVRHTVCSELSSAQFEVFTARCEAAGLDPLRGDCWPAIAYDSDKRMLRVEMRTTIKAIRRIGQASAYFAGVTAQEFTADGASWSEVWLDREHPPHAARCGVYRKGIERPIYAVCLWDNFAQFRERADGSLVPAEHWRVRGPWMLGKCAEAAAYARAIPECDGIYLAETADGGRALPRDRSPAGSAARARFGQIAFRPAERFADRLTTRTSGTATLDEAEERPRGAAAIEARWLEIIGRLAPALTAGERSMLLARLRQRAGDLEDENPHAFEQQLVDEALRKAGARRR